jgi:hypothetical protein
MNNILSVNRSIGETAFAYLARRIAFIPEL